MKEVWNELSVVVRIAQKKAKLQNLRRNDSIAICLYLKWIRTSSWDFNNMSKIGKTLEAERAFLSLEAGISSTKTWAESTYTNEMFLELETGYENIVEIDVLKAYVELRRSRLGKEPEPDESRKEGSCSGRTPCASIAQGTYETPGWLLSVYMRHPSWFLRRDFLSL